MKTFDKNHELEYHIKTCHEKVNEYECEKCEKKFVLEWRLKKHMRNHDSLASMKKCHYFNNGNKCPFEELGCMFAHEVSDNCTFGRTCKNKLCSFKHETENNDDNPKKI